MKNNFIIRHPTSSIQHRTAFIKSEATRLGFLSCGISKAGFLEEEAPRLEKSTWQNGLYGGLF
jgi:epoxyqueuosine reductase